MLTIDFFYCNSLLLTAKRLSNGTNDCLTDCQFACLAVYCRGRYTHFVAFFFKALDNKISNCNVLKRNVYVYDESGGEKWQGENGINN